MDLVSIKGLVQNKLECCNCRYF